MPDICLKDRLAPTWCTERRSWGVMGPGIIFREVDRFHMDRSAEVFSGHIELGHAKDAIFLLVQVFALSVFVISNDVSLRISSVNISSAVGLLLIAGAVAEGLLKGGFVLRKHRLQFPLAVLFLWASASLLISGIKFGSTVFEEAYSYPWAVGLNSPDWRGISFLARLFISIASIELMITKVNTRGRFLRIINILVLAYMLVCAYGIAQIVLYSIFKIELGSVTTYPSFRIGGYVGEPQTFGILLVTGLFPVAGLLKNRFEGLWLDKSALRILLTMAAIDLAFTFSVSMILATAVALFIFRDYVGRKKLALLVFGGAALTVIYREKIMGLIFIKLFSEALSLNSRTLTWNIGYRMLENNLITGAGIGQSPLFAQSIAELINASFASLNFEALRVTILNSYIEWGAEMGLIGIALLFYAAFRTWKIGKGASTEGQNFVKFAFGGTLVALAVSANSYGGAFYMGSFNLSLAMFVAGMEICKKEPKTGELL